MSEVDPLVGCSKDTFPAQRNQKLRTFVSSYGSYDSHGYPEAGNGHNDVKNNIPSTMVISAGNNGAGNNGAGNNDAGNNGAGEVDIRNKNVNDDDEMISDDAAFFHFFKGGIGLGLMDISHAVSHAGLMLGTLLIPVVGAFTLYCTQLLIHASAILANELNQEGLQILHYHETCEEAFRKVPCLKKFAHCFKNLSKGLIILTEILVCSDYILFVALSFREVCQNMSNSHHLWPFLLIALVLLLLTAFFKNLKALVVASMCGVAIQFVGFCIILGICLVGNQSYNVKPYMASWISIPIFYGITLHAFENIAFVLHVQNVMKTPTSLSRFWGPLNTPFFLSAIMHMAIAFCGYRKYGDDIKDSISFNLPPGNILSEIARIALALAILASYPLQMYVPYRHLWEYAGLDKRWRIPFQMTLIFITSIIALAIPLLSILVSIIGSFCSTTICLVIPLILDMCILYHHRNREPYFILKMIKDVFLCMLSVVSLCIGLASAIIEYTHDTVDRF